MTETKVDYIERAQFLQKYAAILKRLAYERNMVVITINNVSADMGAKMDEEDPNKMFTEKQRGRMHSIKPALGMTWTGLINDRILLKRNQHGSSNFTRKIVVDQSSHWPHVEMEFEIVNEGVKGVLK